MAATQRLTAGLIAKAHGLDDPEAILALSVLRLDEQQPPIRAIENLDVFVHISRGPGGAPTPSSALRQVYLRHNAISDLASAVEDELDQVCVSHHRPTTPNNKETTPRQSS